MIASSFIENVSYHVWHVIRFTITIDKQVYLFENAFYACKYGMTYANNACIN